MQVRSTGINDELFDLAIKELGEFVAIPSISNAENNEYDKANLFKAADFVNRKLKEMNFDVEQCTIESSAPFVIASHKQQDTTKPTVLLYGHYDIQPYERDKWKTDPLVLTEKNGRLYGRGASDDKGGIIAIFTAIRQLHSRGESLPVNIKILIEGEEEYDSTHMPALLKFKAERLNAHALVIMDGMNCGVNTGTLGSSFRGVANFKLKVNVPDSCLSDTIKNVNPEEVKSFNLAMRVDALTQPVHSGLGCLLPDPVQDIAKVINSLVASGIFDKKNVIFCTMKAGLPGGGNSIQSHAQAEMKFLVNLEGQQQLNHAIGRLSVKLSSLIAGRLTLTSSCEKFSDTKEYASAQGCLKLASLIASLCTPSSIPGYMDDALWISPDERAVLKASSQTQESYLKDNGALDEVRLRGEPHSSIYERIVETPSISILNIDTQAYGCEVGIRPTGGQDPDRVVKVVKDYLYKQSDGSSVIVIEQGEAGAHAWKANPLLPFSKKYQEALASVFDKMAFLPCGGTLPLLRVFEEAFPHMEMLIPGVEDPETNAHSHNESQDIGLLRNAANSLVAFLEKAGDVSIK